ncbi:MULTISPECIES: DUF2269 domain-containing protein [unclassified Azospirillum]|uniref:DUF2269 family protein n=1 Tax=unclassified Azospirillum TaxID=2630922 RepID=UPI000B76884E|nr:MULTISPECIES: DUF2269 domain-containing protein [unclassified Azospirillum]SNS67690.1 Uncharacterized membrane protein [Azospirillum sp. RU38E]SNS85918.1 Uncharacterized membrane protein [Azospirillum sp. RU37A]
MDDYVLLKYVHILSSTLLFGTGLGTAFHGWMANRSGNLSAAAVVNRNVVWADWLFTTPAVIVQPITGVWLALLAGYRMDSGWLLMAILLYLLVGGCWLPVVWLQIRMRHMAEAALAAGTGLPPLYHRYAALWFALGWPAFIGVLAIFYLMVAKPEF